MLLELKNAHLRDQRLTYDDPSHKYFVDGNPVKISVTGFVHQFFSSFNADKVIQNMMRGKNWENSKYYGMSPQEIKDLWNANGKESADKGTKMHADIEYFHNDVPYSNDSIEFEYFLNFRRNNQTLEAYRTEWMIYDTELDLAGSIDMVYRSGEDYYIYDWKRSKSIVRENRYEKGTGPVKHLHNCNFYHYSLQLNVYKAILENNYDIKLRDFFL